MLQAVLPLCATASLALGPSPDGRALEVLHAWDFETGLQGWQKWSPVTMRQSARRGEAFSGERALWGGIAEDSTMVHLIDGLDFPIAGTTLRFWYLVPQTSTFDRFDVNLRTHEHGPQPNPVFQLSMGIRKGKWTLAEIPFTDFFGWSERAFGSFRVRMFEIAAVGRGEVYLDDVQVLIDRVEAARAERAPSIIWLPGQDAASVPGGTWGRFRKTFGLETLPRFAWLQAAGDDEATVSVNGVELGKAGAYVAGEYDLTGLLQVGSNVVALAVLNHGQGPNPTGAAAVVGWGDTRPDEHILLSDGTWRCSPEAPEGWAASGFDDGAWPTAEVAAEVPTPPWGAIDIYPLRPPLDRTVPDLHVEVGEGAIRGVFSWRGKPGERTEFRAQLNRLASDVTTTPIAAATGTVDAEADGQRVDLFPTAGLSGAHQVEVSFARHDKPVQKVVWLPEDPTEARDPDTAHRVEATGFFRTERVGDRWWLIDPQGNLLFSLSVNAVMQQPYWSLHYHKHVSEHYVDLDTWGEFTCRRLFDWGFNSSTGSDAGLEPYARRNMPYFVGWNLLWAGPWLVSRDGQRVMFPDIFDPEWQRGAEERVRQVTEQYRDDPMVIGYWTDNEITMHAPLSPSQGIMDAFWSPGCQAELIGWLRDRHGDDIAELNRSWSSAWHTYSYASFDAIADDKPTIRGDDDPVAPDLRDFVRHVIRTYAETYVALWKKHDPNHLVCTNRFAGTFDVDFAELLKPYDIVACNTYPRSYWGQTEFDEGQLEWLRAMHQATGKPIIISEWGVTARDSGLPNFWGRLDTQEQRGDAYENVLEQLWDEGYIVGSHWFSWGDSTDAERRNWGIVDAYDRPYLPLAGAMTRANRRIADRVHGWGP